MENRAKYSNTTSNVMHRVLCKSVSIQADGTVSVSCPFGTKCKFMHFAEQNISDNNYYCNKPGNHNTNGCWWKLHSQDTNAEKINKLRLNFYVPLESEYKSACENNKFDTKYTKACSFVRFDNIKGVWMDMCSKPACTFAHSLDQLVPFPCRFGKRCNNHSCSWFHTGDTKKRYAELHKISLPDAKVSGFLRNVKCKAYIHTGLCKNHACRFGHPSRLAFEGDQVVNIPANYEPTICYNEKNNSPCLYFNKCFRLHPIRGETVDAYCERTGCFIKKEKAPVVPLMLKVDDDEEHNELVQEVVSEVVSEPANQEEESEEEDTDDDEVVVTYEKVETIFAPQFSPPPSPSHEMKSSEEQHCALIEKMTALMEPEEQQPKVEEQQPKVEEQHSKVEEQQPKVEEQQPKVEEQHSKVEEQHSKVEEQHSKVEEQQPKVEEQQPKVEEQQPKVEEQHSKVEEQHSKVEEQHSKVEEQQPKVEEQHSKVEEQHSKVEEQQPKVYKPEFEDDKSDDDIDRAEHLSRLIDLYLVRYNSYRFIDDPVDQFLSLKHHVPTEETDFVLVGEHTIDDIRDKIYTFGCNLRDLYTNHHIAYFAFGKMKNAVFLTQKCPQYSTFEEFSRLIETLAEKYHNRQEVIVIQLAPTTIFEGKEICHFNEMVWSSLSSMWNDGTLTFSVWAGNRPCNKFENFFTMNLSVKSLENVGQMNTCMREKCKEAIYTLRVINSKKYDNGCIVTFNFNLAK
jgi:hypothetical protein